MVSGLQSNLQWTLADWEENSLNSGSTIQGDHILAFSQTQKNGSIPDESTWNTHHSVSRDMHTLF